MKSEMDSRVPEVRAEAVDLSSFSWIEAAGQEVRVQRRKVRWICMWHFRIWRLSMRGATTEMERGSEGTLSNFAGSGFSRYIG